MRQYSRILIRKTFKQCSKLGMSHFMLEKPIIGSTAVIVSIPDEAYTDNWLMVNHLFSKPYRWGKQSNSIIFNKPVALLFQGNEPYNCRTAETTLCSSVALLFGTDDSHSKHPLRHCFSKLNLISVSLKSGKTFRSDTIVIIFEFILFFWCIASPRLASNCTIQPEATDEICVSKALFSWKGIISNETLKVLSRKLHTKSYEELCYIYLLFYKI